MADRNNNNNDLGAEETVKDEPESPKPAALAPVKQQQRAPRKPRVKKTSPVEAQHPPPTPQVDDPVRNNPKFFVELSATLKDMKQQERRHRLSTLKIV